MSDLALMQNMFRSRPTEDYLFKDSQIRDLPDNPNVGYANGQTTFECRNITDDTFALSQADFIIPYSIGVNGVLTATNCLGKVTGATASLDVGPVSFVNGEPVGKPAL